MTYHSRVGPILGLGEPPKYPNTQILGFRVKWNLFLRRPKYPNRIQDVSAAVSSPNADHRRKKEHRQTSTVDAARRPAFQRMIFDIADREAKKVVPSGVWVSIWVSKNPNNPNPNKQSVRSGGGFGYLGIWDSHVDSSTLSSYVPVAL